MITAAPTALYRALLARYFVRRARRRFSHVLAAGIDRLTPWSVDGAAVEPLILVANHSSWWDAVLPIIISCSTMRHDAYGMMEHAQLARFRFFRRAGMFSVSRTSPREAMLAIRYAADLLRDSRRILWVFPQGGIVPNDLRPIRCESGTAHLIRMLDGCAVAPVAFRYTVGREEHPAAYIGVGAVRRVDASGTHGVRSATESIASMLEQELDFVRDAMLNEQLDAFAPMLSGRRSISARWPALRNADD